MNMHATHPVRAILFWDTEHVRDVFDPYFNGVAKNTWTFTRMVIHDQLVRKIFKHRGMYPNEWHMVSDEPSMLYPNVEEDDENYENADADYDVSSASDEDNDMGSGEQIDDLIESGTIRLLNWNDVMTDLQLEMRFVDKIQVIQNKHRNMTSKFISKLTSYLVANNPEIPVSNVIQEVQVLLQKGCSYKRAYCGKWQEYTLSCSHALAVYKDNGTRPDAYVPDKYSRETYRRTYQSNFYPVVHEDFWRDAPYNLTLYPPNINNQWDRKKGPRFREEMDYQNPDSP
ncbi:hypothetical protein M9H77_18377 [Catharanthus roseus]|uniref:Uncharacterized protein n=1 Tax=Catharanthus roseus TaxID=4058 RepID=A0ACC0B797_CATRO|nr:hypothetical protein M9H77_18377 [Catharanthus roseus]